MSLQQEDALQSVLERILNEDDEEDEEDEEGEGDGGRRGVQGAVLVISWASGAGSRGGGKRPGQRKGSGARKGGQAPPPPAGARAPVHRGYHPGDPVLPLAHPMPLGRQQAAPLPQLPPSPQEGRGAGWAELQGERPPSKGAGGQGLSNCGTGGRGLMRTSSLQVFSSAGPREGEQHRASSPPTGARAGAEPQGGVHAGYAPGALPVLALGGLALGRRRSFKSDSSDGERTPSQGPPAHRGRTGPRSPGGLPRASSHRSGMGSPGTPHLLSSPSPRGTGQGYTRGTPGYSSGKEAGAGGRAQGCGGGPAAHRLPAGQQHEHPEQRQGRERRRPGQWHRQWHRQRGGRGREQ